MATSPPKIDAICVPADYPAGQDFQGQRLARNREFGPVLGVPRVWWRDTPDGRSIGTREVNHVTENHAKGHPLEGQPRYDWEDRGDGVLYGFLTDAATADPAAEADAGVKAAIAARKTSMKAEIDRLTSLAPGSRTPDQSSLLERLSGRYAAMYPDES